MRARVIEVLMLPCLACDARTEHVVYEDDGGATFIECQVCGERERVKPPPTQ